VTHPSDNISAMAGSSDFNFARSWVSPMPIIKYHTQKKRWACPWARGAPQYLRLPFNIYTMAEARDFKVGKPLGFAKAHHKITPRGKSGHGVGLGKLPEL